MITLIGPAGDSFTFTTIGEGMDTEGRASNKAMSAATKNAYLRLLQIGAGGEDGDSHAGEQTRPTQNRPSAPVAAAQPTLGNRVAQAAGRPQGQTQAPQGQTGEKLSERQSKNLFRLWKHVLHWDRDTYAQQIELVTGEPISDDRNLTKDQASDLIRELKIIAGEPVEDNRVPQRNDGDPGPGEPDYNDEPF